MEKVCTYRSTLTLLAGKYRRTIELPHAIRFPTAMWTSAGQTPLTGSARLFVASNSVTLCVAEYALELCLFEALGEPTSERLVGAYACPETRDRLLARGLIRPPSPTTPPILMQLGNVPITPLLPATRAREPASREVLAPFAAASKNGSNGSNGSSTPRIGRSEHFNADQTFERIHNMVTLPEARLVLVTCADHYLHVFRY